MVPQQPTFLASVRNGTAIHQTSIRDLRVILQIATRHAALSVPSVRPFLNTVKPFDPTFATL